MSPWLQEPESLFLSFLIDCFVLCCVVFFPFPTFFLFSFFFAPFLPSVCRSGRSASVSLRVSVSVFQSLSLSVCVCVSVSVSLSLSTFISVSLSLSSNAQRNAFSFINQFLLIVKESCYH